MNSPAIGAFRLFFVNIVELKPRNSENGSPPPCLSVSTPAFLQDSLNNRFDLKIKIYV